MKSLSEKFQESLSIDLGNVTNVNESWTERKNYKQMLKDIFGKYDKKKDAKPTKRKYGTPVDSKSKAYEILAKYPVQILIDKAGFTPKEIVKSSYGRGEKKEMDKKHYGEFIITQLEEGKFTKEDLINWWQEYDEQVAKNNWHDPKYIVKQLDCTRLWNPYYPKDDSSVTALMDEPAKLARYVMPFRLTQEERDDFVSFLSDPANQDSLKAALKGIKGAIKKARPTFATGAAKHVKSLIDNCEYNGGDIKYLIEKEYESIHKSYYAGANDKDCEASAVIGLILKALNEMYGFEVWSSFDKKDNEDGWDEIEHNITVKGKVEDKTLEGFLDDADYLKVIVKKLKKSEKEKSSGVYASSFSQYYDYDFEVTVLKNEEEVYKKEFKQITIGSYFYSGGW